MSLNWKEINLILDELSLKGSQIQGVIQTAFDVIIFRIHRKGETKNILISLSSGACRIHETFKPFPKSDKPLRFAQFLKSRIVNGYITEASQLGDNRIVRIVIKRGEFEYTMYIRLWSNAANVIVADKGGMILDAMRRLPKRGEVSGKQLTIESYQKAKREYEIRSFSDTPNISFNKKIDEYYSQQGGSLSLEALREQARRTYEGSIGKISAALEHLRKKEASFADAQQLKTYGDLIFSNLTVIKKGDKWLEAADECGAVFRVELDPLVTPQVMAGKYYEQYRKAKKGLVEIQEEIKEGERQLLEIKEKLDRLLSETNPLILAKLLKSPDVTRTAGKSLSKKEKARPGLAFKRGDWLIIVGRSASENDELLRRHVKGNDLWLHARDYHGSYVFIKQRSGKTVPLDILLDAATLAIFYSKGRNNGKGDLFYTQVKYLRRAKDGPKGLVIPTQEKNLHVKVEDKRLRELENCRIV